MPQPFRTKSSAFRRPAIAQPLADLVQPCIAPSLARQGFGESEALLHWPEIVGEALAERCRPVKLQWRPRTRSAEAESPAALVVRVEGAFALALQHMAPVVIERVNGYFGRRCVDRLLLKQGPLPERPQAGRSFPTPDPAALGRAARAAAGIDDERLRLALVALGGKVLRRAPGLPPRAVSGPALG